MNRYIVYETYCAKTDKTYIGSTLVGNKNYLGSGVQLKKDIEKYGPESFERDVLFVCDNLDTALDVERQLVTKDYVRNKKTYNMKTGGGVGWSAVNRTGKNNSPAHRKKSSTDFVKRMHKAWSEQCRIKRELKNKPCDNCKTITINKRFCSRSCSAQVTNIETPRRRKVKQ